MATKARASLHTPLCDLLSIRYPICQAGSRKRSSPAVMRSSSTGMSKAMAVVERILPHGSALCKP